MPSLSELPSNINCKKFIKALECLGFCVSKKGGKGSHVKLTYIMTQKSLTIPKCLNKNVLYYILKEVENITGITWDDISKKM